MDTRAQVTAGTHARLLDAVVQVLADVSVDTLTMQMVAERADVALRTVYNHFPSKEALVVDVYTWLATRTQEAVRDLPADGSPRDLISAFIESFLDVFEHESPGAAVILGVSGIPEFDAKLAEVRGVAARRDHEDPARGASATGCCGCRSSRRSRSCST